MTKHYPTIVIHWSSAPKLEVAETLAALLSDTHNMGWSETVDEAEAFWRVYFDDSARAAQALRGVRAFVDANDPGATVSIEQVEERDWSENFREFFHAARVAPCWWIAPPWERDKARPRPGEHVIIVHPGLAFGTGLHETTRLCLEFIAEEKGGLTRALDVGAGSGVLSVACLRMGATEVEAFEINAMAADNLRRNLELNEASGRVVVHEGDFSQMKPTPAPVILCNMERQHFRPVLPALLDALAHGGLLFATGFIKEGQAEVEALFHEAGLYIVSPRQQGDWLGYVLSRG